MSESVNECERALSYLVLSSRARAAPSSDYANGMGFAPLINTGELCAKDLSQFCGMRLQGNLTDNLHPQASG